MAEKNTGLHSFLTLPRIYDWYQHLVGANRQRRIMVEDYIEPQPGERMLDIGCGTGRILDFLPRGLDYEGFDLNEKYIEQARAHYGNRATFKCQRVFEHSVAEHRGYDIVLAYGILHHLDDAEARQLFAVARQALKPEGRLITIDPCYIPAQSIFARFMVSCDRGRNVRSPEAYLALAQQVFGKTDGHVHHDLLDIPFTHYVLVSRLTRSQ